MDHETQFASELRDLRTLCDEAISREERQRLMESLSEHVFLEPEHQVVFESIRDLYPRGPISAERLRVHLNNRGFPDTDTEKYFQPLPSNRIPQSPPGKVTS
jgi:hypothetical protein